MSDPDPANAIEILSRLHGSDDLVDTLARRALTRYALLQHQRRLHRGLSWQELRLMTDETTFQRACYEESELSERFQEREERVGGRRPFSDEPESRDPIYSPSLRDRKVRYVKHLVQLTMHRDPVYAAIAVGCHLYRYAAGHGDGHRTSSICDLPGFRSWVLGAPEHEPHRSFEQNIRRTRADLFADIHERFDYLDPEVLPPFQTRTLLTLKVPVPSDGADLVHDALASLAPRWEPCPGSEDPGRTRDFFVRLPGRMRATAEDVRHDEIRREAIHRLFHGGGPDKKICGGFHKLIAESKRYPNTKDLDHPDEMLYLPRFPGQPGDRERGIGMVPRSPDPKAPVSAARIAALRAAAAEDLARTRRARATRIRANTLHSATFDASGGCSLVMPASASWLDVLGVDETGPLLLAVVPLSRLKDFEGAQFGPAETSFVLPSGEPITITLQQIDSGILVRAALSRSQRPRGGMTRPRGRLIDWEDLHRLTATLRVEDPSSLNTLMDAIEHAAAALPRPYQLDDAWPLLELLEQIVHRIWVVPSLTRNFIDRYVELQSRTPNRPFAWVLIWGINEFLERGSQVEIGREIARRLLGRELDPGSANVFTILLALRPDELAPVTRDPSVVLPRPDDAVVRLHEIADGLIRDVQTTDPPSIRVPDLVSTSTFSVLTDFWREGVETAPGLGIVAMGEMKRVLAVVVNALDDNPEAIETLCLNLLRRADMDGSEEHSSFLTIEALERPRDMAPEACAIAMGKYMFLVRDYDLAYGIQVCVAEAFEEGGDLHEPPPYRVVQAEDAWLVTPSVAPGVPHPVSVYFTIFCAALDARVELTPRAEWLNRRMTWHPSIAA